MAGVKLAAGESLLVAARGKGPEHGLWQFRPAGDGWQGRQLAEVGQLSSLARHPRLPVVYGTGSVRGEILAFHLERDRARPMGVAASGDDPCHVAVHPSGRLLVATNYGSGSLTLQSLAADGSFLGAPSFLPFEGSGPDAERQESAHPHQAVFSENLLFVVDLGADRLRRYHVDDARPAAEALSPAGDLAMPSGSGPRHMVELPDGRVAVDGELSATLVVGGQSEPAMLASVPSSGRSGPAKTRTPRNYPGDVALSVDGRFVYLANRGYDTLAVFDVGGGSVARIGEVDAGAAWPQHLLVADGHLLVAGWDSNRVTAVKLGEQGFAGAAETLFECPGPGWLLLWRD